MNGKIVKGIAGFYYVHGENGKVYECKAKGNFRNKKIKPLVGDDVVIDILDDAKELGNIVEVLPRTSCLLRPEVANVDQALIIFAVKDPEPNIGLLNRFLIRMQKEQVDTVICFNKMELASDEECQQLKDIFADAGCRIVFTSVKKQQGLDDIRAIIQGKTTALAGPSGVGKSSMMNLLYPDAVMETGTISDKIKRGKHTTRHSELFCVEEGTFLMDTPGFTSLYVNELEKEDLRFYFNEFLAYEGKCRFNGCVHVNEPECAVKNAVQEHIISKVRYDSYLEIYEELKNIRRY